MPEVGIYSLPIEEQEMQDTITKRSTILNEDQENPCYDVCTDETMNGLSNQHTTILIKENFNYEFQNSQLVLTLSVNEQNNNRLSNNEANVTNKKENKTNPETVASDETTETPKKKSNKKTSHRSHVDLKYSNNSPNYKVILFRKLFQNYFILIFFYFNSSLTRKMENSTCNTHILRIHPAKLFSKAYLAAYGLFLTSGPLQNRT
jgi:hypothetical protein